MEKTCGMCKWLLEEGDKIGDWKHSTALKAGRGFCLLMDLFTMHNTEHPACNDYLEADDGED